MLNCPTQEPWQASIASRDRSIRRALERWVRLWRHAGGSLHASVAAHGRRGRKSRCRSLESLAPGHTHAASGTGLSGGLSRFPPAIPFHALLLAGAQRCCDLYSGTAEMLACWWLNGGVRAILAAESRRERAMRCVALGPVACPLRSGRVASV